MEMIKAFKKLVKGSCYGLMMDAKPFKLSESLLVFGDARGGTTWLMEMLSRIPGTIMLEEPLHLRDGCFDPDLNFGWRQPIPKEAVWPAAKMAFERLLSGEYHSLSALRPNSWSRMLTGNRLLLKFVRGNALLPWLSAQFEFRHAPIYLLRHPLAVAASQIRNFPETADFRTFVLPSHPYHEHYLEHAPFLHGLSTRLQQLVALWCLHNTEALKEEQSPWITIHYEHLLRYPQETLEELSKKWKLPFPRTLFQQIEKPSYSDYSNDLRLAKDLQLKKWHQQIPSGEQEKIQIILDHFGIKAYRAAEVYPCGSDRHQASNRV